MDRIWAVSQWQRQIEGHHVPINRCHCHSFPQCFYLTLCLQRHVCYLSEHLMSHYTNTANLWNLSVVCFSWSGVPGSRSTALSSASQTPEARRTLNRWWAASCECRPTYPTSNVFKITGLLSARKTKDSMSLWKALQYPDIEFFRFSREVCSVQNVHLYKLWQSLVSHWLWICPSSLLRLRVIEGANEGTVCLHQSLELCCFKAVG